MEVYEKLRERLDNLGPGFPVSASGVEIRILKKLFTEEEADFFLHLAPLLEDPKDTARRLGRDPVQTAELMERMAQKGLLFRNRKGESVRYAAVPYVVGIFEFQLNRMDKDFARDMETYMQESFDLTVESHKTPILRTIPIQKDLVAEWPVAPYEDVLAIIDQQETIALCPCICRTMSTLNDRTCDKPLEVCFAFGSHAHYYVENHMGRYITREEAKEVVRQNEKAGLVMQPFNSQKVGGMCSCCGDCCGMLRSLKKQPRPAEIVQSNYFAQVNSEECIGCQTCLDRCQMEAIEMVDETASILLERCIGCGLCVTTCPQEAMKLVKKPEDQLYQPPQSGAETYMRIALERGKNLMPQI
jgi:H+/Na+-translocating ferredoxin:NAD+ oxidoreductase subunit B